MIRNQRAGRFSATSPVLGRLRRTSLVVSFRECISDAIGANELFLSRRAGYATPIVVSKVWMSGILSERGCCCERTPGMRTPCSIRVFLVDGTPSGVITADIPTWTGKVISAPRTRLGDVIKRKETESCGIYVLSGPNIE